MNLVMSTPATMTQRRIREKTREGPAHSLQTGSIDCLSSLSRSFSFTTCYLLKSLFTAERYNTQSLHSLSYAPAICSRVTLVVSLTCRETRRGERPGQRQKSPQCVHTLHSVSRMLQVHFVSHLCVHSLSVTFSAFRVLFACFVSVRDCMKYERR